MEESQRLTEADVQDIQLELIRRAQHNALDGKRIFEDLQSHQDWWMRTASAWLTFLRQ